MRRLIASLSSGIPAALIELRTLGRTLKTRAVDVLAYFDRPGTSNGPTEAINGRLEHLARAATGRVDPDADDGLSPLLLAVSDNGSQMIATGTRRFMARSRSRNTGRPSP